MSSRFFTNQSGNSLLKKFEGVFKNIESIRHFDALVGYFRASGYYKVRLFLDKIHAKVYIFRPANFNEYAPCEVITGSSNLTDSGLGSNPESNYEFNVSLRQFEDVKFATNEKMENCLTIHQTS